MNIDVTEIIALFAQLAGPAFSVALSLALARNWFTHSFRWAQTGGSNCNGRRYDFEEQTEQESTVDEVLTNEEQTEQDSSGSLDDILAGVNELLEQSASYNAYMEKRI